MKTNNPTDSYLDDLLSPFENFSVRKLGDNMVNNFSPVFTYAVTPWNRDKTDWTDSLAEVLTMAKLS